MIHIVLWMVLAQSQDVFHSEDDSLVVSNVDHVTKYSFDDAGNMNVAGTGKPVHILVNSFGLTLDAESVDATAKESAAKAWYFTETHAKSTVLVRVNSEVATSWQKAHRPAKPAPNPPPPAYQFTMKTEALDYSGTETEGDMSLPAPFSADGRLDGVRVGTAEGAMQAIRYSETFVVKGASGELKVDPTPGAGIRAVRSGHFEGPVTFSADRDEFIHRTVPLTQSHLRNGQCDRLVIATDADGETMTLEGHVRFDLETERGTSRFRNGDTVVVRLDPNLALVSVKGSGSPLETSVPIRPKKQ